MGAVMTVPVLSLDSKYPGLMRVTVLSDNTEASVLITREEARQFGIDVLVMSEQGFMRAEPAGPGTYDPECCAACRSRAALVSEIAEARLAAEFAHKGRTLMALSDTGEDDPSAQHEHPYADELHLGGG